MNPLGKSFSEVLPDSSRLSKEVVRNYYVGTTPVTERTALIDGGESGRLRWTIRPDSTTVDVFVGDAKLSTRADEPGLEQVVLVDKNNDNKIDHVAIKRTGQVGMDNFDGPGFGFNQDGSQNGMNSAALDDLPNIGDSKIGNPIWMFLRNLMP